MKKRIIITGMTCASCVKHIEDGVGKLKGLNKININLLNGYADVDFNSDVLSLEDIYKTIIDCGYNIIDEEATISKDTKDKSLTKLIICSILLVILLALHFANLFTNNVFLIINIHKSPLTYGIICFILLLPILIIYRKYYINGYKMIIKRHPNMDSLIAIGSSIATIYGLISLIIMAYSTSMYTNNLIEYYEYSNTINKYRHSMFFESSAMILTLVSLGKYLENLSKEKTKDKVAKLISLSPTKAIKLVDNKEENVLAKTLVVNDIVIVRKGDAIPIDGVIIEGNGTLSQANITGESLPVEKSVNDYVYSSSILLSGYLNIRATKDYINTELSNIIRLVEEASNSKAPISRLADKVSGFFVPVVFIISIITFIVNYLISKSIEQSINSSISVLVIACPCALGLATPVAIMVASGVSAENHIIVKNAQVLEKASKIKCIVFDKTGTITKGETKVISYQNNSKLSNYIINSILYSLESKSEHVLSKAIIDYVSSKDYKLEEVTNYDVIEGMGIKGTILNTTYYIGNSKYLNTHRITEVNNSVDSLSLYLFTEKELLCTILISDVIKEESPYVMSKLHESNIRTIMLTGDNNTIANKIAEKCNIDTVYSDVTPMLKLEIINRIKEETNGLVAMVGDGVNDSLALSYADVGISLKKASDIAKDSSDIILLRDNLIDICNVIKLSKNTLNTIKRNLFFAFFYNFICIILATNFLDYPFGLKITPMISSIAMSISSVSVVLSSLSINLFKKIDYIKEDKIIKTTNKVKLIKINVYGMMCEHCEKRVEKALTNINNITYVKANHNNNNVDIKYKDRLDIEQVKSLIKNAGYTVDEKNEVE